MQLTLDLPTKIAKSEYDYGNRSTGGSHGVVLTKPHVVNLILDLAGYTPTRDLTALRLLEPSCGRGAFLVEATRRLMAYARRTGLGAREIERCITAFDVDSEHTENAQKLTKDILLSEGINAEDADYLVNLWVCNDDFLLASKFGPFDLIVGNPPYIRIEQLSAKLFGEYRALYSTLYDRADLYVAFIERSLHLLSSNGVLAFICADRWTSNKYGAPLRKLITSRFRVETYIDLHTASPFESEVNAYPSIFLIKPGNSSSVPVFTMNTASSEECAAVAAWFRDPKNGQASRGVRLAQYSEWFEGDEPWVLSSPTQLAILRELEKKYRPIETFGRVGIGVATGNDSVYIVGEDVDIEPDRLVPLVMREDIVQGNIQDAHRFVINTFSPEGRIIDLSSYPRLARYFAERVDDVKKRHVAQKNPLSWYRTIDRVYPDLALRPKLLIPDIAGSNEVVFEPGHYHPHHNLYFVTSEVWDLEVLGGLLSSRVALFFVWSYAVKMRGGYLRFQAQYLRRIRLPSPQSVDPQLANSLKTAFRARDFKMLDSLALRAYQLDELPEFDFVDTRS